MRNNGPRYRLAKRLIWWLMKFVAYGLREWELAARLRDVYNSTPYAGEGPTRNADGTAPEPPK